MRARFHLQTFVVPEGKGIRARTLICTDVRNLRMKATLILYVFPLVLTLGFIRGCTCGKMGGVTSSVKGGVRTILMASG